MRPHLTQRDWFALSIGLALALTSACAAQAPTPAAPIAADATKFLADVNSTMLRLSIEASRTGWVQSTYITVDTEAINARMDQLLTEATARFAKEAARFDQVTVSPEERRQLNLLKLALEKVTPSNPAEAEELAKLAAGLEATYGRGKWCKDAAKPDTCLDIEKITEELATSRDPKRLQDVWEGWHTVSPPMRQNYTRFVELANKGAKELGFADTGAMWRLKYDMPADEFTKEVDRLWEQVKPLYVSLHAYVRMKLHEKYGEAVPASGPMPAHMLGNIWAQDWSNVFEFVAPANASPGFLAERHPEAPKGDAGRDDEDGRAVLHVARLRAAAADLLGAFTARQAGRPRRRLPRQRVGHRLRRRPPHQDVHRSD